MQDRTIMDKPHTTSHSYLLRLWQTSSVEQQVWRASLEHVPTGERLGFASLEQLFIFLMQQTEKASQAPDARTHRYSPNTAGETPKGA
jgi:hypothetical protein